MENFIFSAVNTAGKILKFMKSEIGLRKLKNGFQ